MKNKVVTREDVMIDIINKCDAGYMAMVDPDGKPYVVPMNFGFEDKVIYLHSAANGHKIDILRNNPEVCIAFSTDHELQYINEPVACSWSMKYRSVLVYGKVEFIDDYDERIRAMNVIMLKYAKRVFSYNAPAIKEVLPFRVIIERMEGRVYGHMM
ncbi:MAG: pyridoxamine 5'-phosphate oxidase family protein [Bacteroidales bacterium]|jgi:nitroimidazol reductase NimA-like FMN-containing flavoprotein (pyridoxamine 5'-phosphate oxidase superfamily)|nr:pyridoxamine 5'-phosphate oxidase family protein [Bacteroidales bacterium]